MTIRYLSLYVLLLALLSSCSNNKEKAGTNTLDTIPMMVMQIQKCSKLYAAEYHVRKIITHDDQLKLDGTFMQQDFSIDLPLGKRKIAIPLDATIKAYIDFGRFSKENVIRKGDKIELILPDPQVTLTSTRIRHDEVKRYVSLTRRNFSDEELTSYERQGRQVIINNIPRMGVVETARENAARTLIPIITQMGFKEKDITITFRKDFSLENLLKEMTSDK